MTSKITEPSAGSRKLAADNSISRPPHYSRGNRLTCEYYWIFPAGRKRFDRNRLQRIMY